MSWEIPSYYQIINETIKKTWWHILLDYYSVDFAEIEHYQVVGDWNLTNFLTNIAQALGASRCGFHRYLYQHHAQDCSADTRKDYDSILHIAQATLAGLVG